MILLTGATGTVGSHLLQELCSQGHPVRALVRSPERADTLRGLHCETAVGTYEDSESLRHAAHGVDRVFLLSPGSAQMAAQEKALVDVLDRDVHVVKLAARGFDSSSGALAAQHAETVRHLQGRGQPTTVVAPSSFLQNLLGQVASITATGRLHVPAGQAAVAHVDARDVASVAAHALTSDGHEGATYVVTGPEALTYDEVASRLGAAIGREVTYVDVPPHAAREAMVGVGLDPWLADALVELHVAHQQEGTQEVTDEVTRATGRGARTLEDFLADHQAAFRTA